MAATHTPGPWEIESSEDGKHHWIRPVAGRGFGWVGDRYLAVSGNIDIQDARLIAAAPDLLAALKKIESELDLRMTHQADREEYPVWNQLWDIAHIAITEATAP